MKYNLEVGKVISIVYGPSINKIGTIIDILDQKRVLVDGPCGRQIINLKRIELTKFKMDVDNKINSKAVHRKFLECHALKNWYEGKKGKHTLKKLAKKNFTDFDHFKYMIGKKHFSKFVTLNKNKVK